MMRARLLITFVAGAILCLWAGGAAGQYRLAEHDVGESQFIAPPRMITPATDPVDLTGKATLDFSWSIHEGDQVHREYYDFRLYKGPQAFGPALIMKKRVGPRESKLSVPSDLFEDGGLYTWTLRQVYTGSVKSSRSFDTFKVRKR